MSYGWHDFVGNIGVLMILGCYLLIQVERMDVRRLLYPVLNGVGALLIVVSLMVDFNLSSFLIELAWFAISIFAIARQLRRSQRVTAQTGAGSSSGGRGRRRPGNTGA